MGLFRFLQGFARITATIAVLGSILAFSRESRAQASVSVTTINITRKVAFRSDQNKRYYVSRADCLADDVITFPVVMSGYGGSNLEVWASQSNDCSDPTYRTTSTASCWRLYSALPSSQATSVAVNVRDFVVRPPVGTTDGAGLGTEESCTSASSTVQSVTLYFMLMQGTTMVANATPWPTSVDLLGPSPPVVGALGAGGQLLKAKWTASSDSEVMAYRVFCEKLTPGGCSEAGSGTGGTGGTGGAGGASGSAGRSGADGGGAAAGAADASTNDAKTDASADADQDANDDAAETSPSASRLLASAADADVGDVDCTTASSTNCASSLTEGATLTLDQMKQFDCGSATGASSNSLTIKDLVNDQRYAVAIAAVDSVENVGSLSIVQCATPQVVRGFDEEYTNAGGKAGGATFCSVGWGSASARERVGWGVFAPTLVGLLLRLRRRRTASRAARSTH